MIMLMHILTCWSWWSWLCRMLEWYLCRKGITTIQILPIKTYMHLKMITIYLWYIIQVLQHHICTCTCILCHHNNKRDLNVIICVTNRAYWFEIKYTSSLCEMIYRSMYTLRQWAQCVLFPIHAYKYMHVRTIWFVCHIDLFVHKSVSNNYTQRNITITLT